LTQAVRKSVFFFNGWAYINDFGYVISHFEM